MSLLHINESILRAALLALAYKATDDLKYGRNVDKAAEELKGAMTAYMIAFFVEEPKWHEDYHLYVVERSRLDAQTKH